MRWWSNQAEAVNVTKTDLRAAVDAADAWVDSSAASFNAALPQPARAVLTADQKALLLVAVVLARRSIPTLRRLFEEVD